MKNKLILLLAFGFIFMIPIANAKVENFTGPGATSFSVTGTFSEELTTSKYGFYSFNYSGFGSNSVSAVFTPNPKMEYSVGASSVKFGFIFLADEYITSDYLNLSTSCTSFGGIRDEDGIDGRFDPPESYNYYQYGQSDCYTSGVSNFKKNNVSFSVTIKQSSSYFVCDIYSTSASSSGYMVAQCPLNEKYSYIDGVYIYAMRNDGPFSKGTIGVSRSFSFSREVDSTSSITNALNQNSQKEIDAMNKNADRAHADSQEQLKESKKQTDFLTSDEAPDSDISVLGDVQGIFPPGPVDSLLNIPFMFLSVVTSSFSGTCVPISGNWVFDTTLTIPCFSEVFYNNVPDALMVFINLIPSSFLLIKYFKHLYKKVDRAVSMETNSDDEWGCI